MLIMSLLLSYAYLRSHVGATVTVINGCEPVNIRLKRKWTEVNKTLGYVWQILGRLYVMDLQCVDTVGWVRSKTSRREKTRTRLNTHYYNSGRLKNGH